MSYEFFIFRAMLPLIGLVVLAVGTRVLIRLFFPRRPPKKKLNRCKCGYPLDQLSVARCPECGRVIHFDATAEELGLTDEELGRAQAARLRRIKLETENCPQQDSNLRP